MNNFSSTDPLFCRLIANDPNYVPAELYVSESNGHLFKAGDTAILHELESYPEYNDEQVEISSIREDGPRGKAYYVKGRINEVVNWVYEYRLK